MHIRVLVYNDSFLKEFDKGSIVYTDHHHISIDVHGTLPRNVTSEWDSARGVLFPRAYADTNDDSQIVTFSRFLFSHWQRCLHTASIFIDTFIHTSIRVSG